MISRLLPVLMLLAFLALGDIQAASYSGNAISDRGTLGATKDPVFFKVDGQRLSGTFYSNAMGEKVSFNDHISSGGHFHLRMASPSGIRILITGQVGLGRITAHGRISETDHRSATFRLKAGKKPLSAGPDDVLPDLTGRHRLPSPNFDWYTPLGLNIEKTKTDYTYTFALPDFGRPGHFRFPTKIDSGAYIAGSSNPYGPPSDPVTMYLTIQIDPVRRVTLFHTLVIFAAPGDTHAPVIYEVYESY